MIARRLSGRGLLVLLVLISTPAGAHALGTVDLVEDLNPEVLTGRGIGTGAARPTRVGDRIFFAGRDADHGVELWTSDGTEAGTRLVRDIRPGATGSFPSNVVDVGGVAFFVADDGEHGAELWRSDGTAAGTRLVRDIMPGPAESDTWNLVELNGILLFNADDGVAASELWRSDGTRAGTRLVKDVWPGPEHGGPDKLTRVGDRVFFAASDATHGYELWVTDGTADGTTLVADVNPGPNGSIYSRRSRPLVALGDEIFFGADDGVHGIELWKSDGTPEGTTLVRDLVPGPDSSRALPEGSAGGEVYLTVDGEEGTRPLWASDGTAAGTRLVNDVGPGRKDSVAAVGEHLFFVGDVGSRSERGAQLWVTDGTPGGTTLLADVLDPAACSPKHHFRDLIAVDGRVYFAGRTPGGDEELWTSDGTPAGTHRAVDIVPGGASQPREFAVLDDTLYFVADDGVHGFELWTSDGTPEGTALVADNFQSTASLYTGTDLHPFGDRVFFGGLLGLYASDGTVEGTGVIPGTESLRLIEAGSRPYADPPIAAVGDDLYFWTYAASGSALWRMDREGATPTRVASYAGLPPAVDSAPLGDDLIYHPGPLHQLWRTDGGEPLLLADFAESGGRFGDGLFSVGDEVLFGADDGEHGFELWRTDGTPEGTRLVKDLHPEGHGFVGSLTDLRPIVAGHLLYFAGNDGRTGVEIWRTDGTEAGTFRLTDLAPGNESGEILVEAWAGTPGGRLFLLVQGEPDDFGRVALQLWTSDGTVRGTRRVTTARVASDGRGFVSLGESVYFTADDENGNPRLWRSDGTTTGTGPLGSNPPRIAELRATSRALYFLEGYPIPHPTVVWTSDGTAAGTAPLATLDGDFTAFELGPLVDAGGRIFTLGDDGVRGLELLVLSCGDGDLDAGEECDAGLDNGARNGFCSLACERTSSGGRIFAPLQRRGGGSSPPTQRSRGPRDARHFVPSR